MVGDASTSKGGLVLSLTPNDTLIWIPVDENDPGGYGPTIPPPDVPPPPYPGPVYTPPELQPPTPTPPRPSSGPITLPSPSPGVGLGTLAVIAVVALLAFRRSR